MPLRADISQHYRLKAVIEQLFGNQAWLDLKETSSISKWRNYLIKALQALETAREQSIEIYDEPWAQECKENIQRGVALLKSSKDFETALSAFSATLVVHGFLQVGMMPDRRVKDKVTLDPRNWRLNQHRSVLIIQSQTQIEALFWSSQQRLIGVAEQFKLHAEYRKSNSNLPYSKWCHNRGA